MEKATKEVNSKLEQLVAKYERDAKLQEAKKEKEEKEIEVNDTK
jgi:hypothetical protein